MLQRLGCESLLYCSTLTGTVKSRTKNIRLEECTSYVRIAASSGQPNTPKWVISGCKFRFVFSPRSPKLQERGRFRSTFQPAQMPEP